MSEYNDPNKGRVYRCDGEFHHKRCEIVNDHHSEFKYFLDVLNGDTYHFCSMKCLATWVAGFVKDD